MESDWWERNGSCEGWKPLLRGMICVYWSKCFGGLLIISSTVDEIFFEAPDIRRGIGRALFRPPADDHARRGSP